MDPSPIKTCTNNDQKGLVWKNSFSLLEFNLETVEGPALPLKSINNLHGSDGLPPGVLGVCHRIPDDVLKEVPEDASDLLIDVTADTLDTTSPGETADGWLCDTLDVLTHNLAMPLGTTLTKTLTTFASSGHSD